MKLHMFVTFPHISLQEFLGAFYFIMMLNAGESIESLLGSECKEPIFMMNSLFLHFRLWFLYSDQKYFTLEKIIRFVTDWSTIAWKELSLSR